VNEQAIFEALDAARKGLHDCLGELEACAPHDPNVGRSFSDVRAAFALLGDLSQLRDRVSQEAQARLTGRLSELLRLNALLSKAVQQDRERLAGLLLKSRQGLRTIDAMSESTSDSTSAGGTCDVSA